MECIFSEIEGVAQSSVHDYLLFIRQRWINTDDLTCVFAYMSMCICILFLTDRWGEAASASLTQAAFVKALTFAAAVKVSSERWVLLDLDRGVLNHSVLLLFESKGEGKI